MQIQRAALLVAMVCFGTSALAVDAYVCVVNHTAGISFNAATKKWEPSIFRSDGSFLVSRASGEEQTRGAAWVVKQVGQKTPSFVCDSDFSKPGYLVCKGVLGEFIFNRSNSRFLSTYMYGYVTDTARGGEFGAEGDNTPAIRAGTCSPV
jgi:hypothetical protein